MGVLSELFPAKKDALKELGPKVFGAGWKYRLAAHAEVAVRTVHRWCDPKQTNRVPSVDLLNFLSDQAETLKTLELRENISKQVQFQITSGQLHPDVVAALLTDIAEDFKTAKTPKDKVRSPKE